MEEETGTIRRHRGEAPPAGDEDSQAPGPRLALEPTRVWEALAPEGLQWEPAREPPFPGRKPHLHFLSMMQGERAATGCPE